MIGILGGMGPESTAYTYLRLIRFCQERFGAKLDSDFPPILVFSMPVPDVVEEGSDDKEVFALLESGIGRLSAAGAAFSFIACNTMQGFVPQLRKRYPMLSLVEETACSARRSGIRNWGLLGTEVTLRKGCYQRALEDYGIGTIAPARAGSGSQEDVTRAIREILAGGDIGRPRNRLQGVVKELEREGAEGVILACTDLPLALCASDVRLPLLDTADISAKAAVMRYRSMRGLDGGNPPF